MSLHQCTGVATGGDVTERSPEVSKYYPALFVTVQLVFKIAWEIKLVSISYQYIYFFEFQG